MKKQKVGLLICLLVLIVAIATIGGVVGGFSGAMSELSLATKSKTADAILASANVQDKTVVSVPVLYYDQKMDECVDIYDIGLQAKLEVRQFEWSSCGYYSKKIETGMLETGLDTQYLPVAKGGTELPNRGVSGENFKRWFNSVEGQSKSYAGILNFVYDAEVASFWYEDEDFYPLDGITLSNKESVNRDGHNHLFTMNLGMPFQVLANGKESFAITADDDTWVFVGDTLVLDMGGIHDAVMGKFVIHEDGEVYAAVGDEDLAYTGVKFDAGDGAIVRIFHADRDSESSEIRVNFVNILPNITNTSLAKNEGGVEVAYDPTDPSYIAPLGESLAVGPDNRKSLLAMITTQVVALGALGALVVMTISVAWRYLRRDHNQAE